MNPINWGSLAIAWCTVLLNGAALVWNLTNISRQGKRTDAFMQRMQRENDAWTQRMIDTYGLEQEPIP